MPGKRIPELDAIAGASTANDDNLVIYDTSDGATKRILRSQLAAGIVGDLPYTPSGSISATTVPTAIAELDTEKQPIDAGLTSIAGLTTAANKMIYTTAADTYAVADLTVAGRALLDDANNTAQRITLGLEIGVNVQAYDADTAKLDVAQTFTAQQTLSSGLVLQTISAANIAAIANAVNTTGKTAGKIVYDTTNTRIMVASGALAASRWYVADGSAFVTPA